MVVYDNKETDGHFLALDQLMVSIGASLLMVAVVFGLAHLVGLSGIVGHLLG